MTGRTVVGVALLVALLAGGCSPSPQPQAPSPPPLAHGTAARIELSSAPGVGPTGGTALITARVQDAYGALVARQSVGFTTSAGSFSETPVTTTEDGIARTVLTAPAGSAQVTARAGSIETTPLVVAVQPQTVTGPPLPNPPAQPPPEPPSPTGPLTVTLLYTAGVAGSSTSFSLAMVGGLASAEWTFGDSASLTTNVPTATHVYAAPGSYLARVTAHDQGGRVASDTKAITIAPVPTPAPPAPLDPPRYDIAIALNPSTSPQHNSPIQVTASINGQFTPPPIESIAFNCGGLGAVNPPPSLSTTVTCTYNRAGTVTAEVTVSGGAIISTASKTFVVY